MRHVAAVTLIGLVAVVALAACGGDGAAPGPTASPTVSSARTAQPTPTVEKFGGVEVRPMAVGPAFELPEGVALLIEIGCTQCDGPVEGIERIYRDASGEMRRETLFSRPSGPYGEPYISSLAVSTDGQTLALTVCAPGYCGGLGPVTEDAATALHLSRDAGETWEVAVNFESSYIVSAVLADRLLLQRLPAGEFESAFYEYFPAGAPVEPPEGRVWPVSFGSGELVWRTLDGGLAREDGSPLVTLGEEYIPVWTGRSGIQAGPSGGYAVMYAPREENDDRYVLANFDRDEQLAGVHSLDSFSRVSTWLPTGEPVGTAWFQGDELTDPVPRPQVGGASLPALFDLEAGLIRPITNPFLETLARNRVLAVVPWPPAVP